MCPPHSAKTPQTRRLRRGFTLVELLIAVVVLTILAAVALPSYQRMVQKGRRADAVALLSRIQQAQERWRSNNSSYAGTLAALNFTHAVSDKGYYQAALSDVSATGYTITATAVSGSAQAGDTACTSMTVTQSSGNLAYGGTTNGCWAQ